MKIAVLHSRINEGASRDEQDIMVQVEVVSQALSVLGFEPVTIPFSLNLEMAISALQKARPDMVFNLVETVDGKGRFVCLAPAILDSLRLPYTGSRTEALFLTTNKLLTKKILKPLGLPTPQWISLENTQGKPTTTPFAEAITTKSGTETTATTITDTEGRGRTAGKESMAGTGAPVMTAGKEVNEVSGTGTMAGSTSYIIKSVWEHASIGLDDASVIAVDQFPRSSRDRSLHNQNRCNQNLHHVHQKMEHRREVDGQDCFAEIYIEGREFNLSLLADDSGPEVLPPAEILFEDYPAGKLKIVDYRAKWDEDSFEYRHTPRCFDFPSQDCPLLERLAELARKCWHIFELRGYARVDFRVDHEGNPWILEINANPCISPDSGFAAAAKQAGLSFEQVIQRIINASDRNIVIK
ncbi:MAG: D-alanine--D-alanine ligase [bacterium]